MNEISHLIFEVTQKCNNNCSYCYNVWKQGDYPGGELDTRDYLRVIDKAIKESGCETVAFSGGEPLLRDDLEELVGCAKSFGCKVMVVSNGVLLYGRRAESLVKAGVDHFELPVLSASRSVHDMLAGNEAFDPVTAAMVEVKRCGATLSTVFVLTKQNLHELEGAIEVSVALGADYFNIDRFVPGGTGLGNLDLLLPHARQIVAALKRADEMAGRYHIPVMCPIPVEPCVLGDAVFQNLQMGECLCGKMKFVVDPLGNLRICEQNPAILGNVLEMDLGELAALPDVAAFQVPPYEKCINCQDNETCRGGCRYTDTPYQ